MKVNSDLAFRAKRYAGLATHIQRNEVLENETIYFNNLNDIDKAKYQLEIEQNLLLIKSRLIHLYNYVDNKTPILEI
ncbi:MAG: hypothetical protein ACKVOU_04730 [Cytophagales bacterium]